jgi:hypothetical protein
MAIVPAIYTIQGGDAELPKSREKVLSAKNLPGAPLIAAFDAWEFLPELKIPPCGNRRWDRPSLRTHYCALGALHSAPFNAEDLSKSRSFPEALPSLLPPLRELCHVVVPSRPVHHYVEPALDPDA